MAKKWTYDPMCYDLAMHFLADNPKLNNYPARHWLAHALQTCAETELECMTDYGVPTEESK